MRQYTEEQLQDVLNLDGPPTIRQLALQTMSDRNDAMMDDRRDLKYQRPELKRQHFVAPKPVVALQEQRQEPEKRQRENQEETQVVKEPPKQELNKAEDSIKLQAMEQMTAKKKDNLMMGCLGFVALIAVVIIVVRECFVSKST